METIAPPPLNLTVDLLRDCGVGDIAATRFMPVLNELLPYYSIDTHLRVSHFLAQCIHESAGFTALREFASGKQYEGRKDLGNTERGDGERFRGRGVLQLTGRANYTAFAKKFGIDCVNNPALLEIPRWALASALDYWNVRRINQWADKDNVLAVSQIINLGSIPRPGSKRQRIPNGYDHRVRATEWCKEVLAPVFSDTKK
ncbi:hypothetical protein [Spirosoma sp. 209]|uniref:glycoside hydrolase family 19 protein n=1 Tax=Spirosoma sp. 209 TaxID=1955701 RepID=UPI00098D0656|nr:hypothetical protein [Spirosoma sp. 209]